MKFSSFIVEMDNMPPSEPQEVDKPVSDDKPKIITPNKKLILPAQPKREKPAGFTPSGVKKVDAFPNKVKDPYGTGNRRHDHGEETNKRLKDYQIEMYDELARNRDYEYSYDMDHDDIIKKYEKETEDMDLPSMMRHNNFTFKHYVVGNELSHFLRYGDTPYRGNMSLDDYTKYWQAFGDVMSDEAEGAPDKLWRGIHKNIFKDLQPGQIITDPGFMSTATTPDGTAYEFGPQSGGVMMHINNESDAFAYGIDMDLWGENEQDEFVLLPNTALQFTGKENDENYHFNLLEPNFKHIDKYGRVYAHADKNKYEDPRDRERYKEMGFMESRQPLKLLNKMKDKMKEAFQQRMNDFHFEVLTPEEPEEEREPKKFDDFTAQFDHDD